LLNLDGVITVGIGGDGSAVAAAAAAGSATGQWPSDDHGGACLQIPEDLSVVGFDDLPLTRWIGPPLTTVRQPLTEMAETAARLILDLGRGRQPSTRVDLATNLVVRSSTAAPGH
jgi:hypothetical protein